MSFCTNSSSKAGGKVSYVLELKRQSTDGHRKQHFCFKKVAPYSLHVLTLAQINSGYFRMAHHSPHLFPDPLNSSSWRSSQISHSGDRRGCQNPNPPALYED